MIGLYVAIASLINIFPSVCCCISVQVEHLAGAYATYISKHVRYVYFALCVFVWFFEGLHMVFPVWVFPIHVKNFWNWKRQLSA
jgi:hypothetical protein